MSPTSRSQLVRYGAALLAVAVAFLARMFLDPFLGKSPSLHDLLRRCGCGCLVRGPRSRVSEHCPRLSCWRLFLHFTSVRD